MPTARKIRPKVGVDLKKLSEELGAPIKEGKVTAARGKFYLTVGRAKKEIVVGDTTPLAEVKALVGQPVGVVVSGKTLVAIGGLIGKRPWILCYIPAPDLFRNLREGLRADLLKRYVDQGVIPAQAARQLGPLAR